MTPSTPALHDRPAHELISVYLQKQLSLVEVTRSVLAHIERWETHLRATYLLRPERALAQAQASERRWQRNEPCGPLEHIAFTVPFNISEQPAAAINCGYTRRALPIGLQIAGRRFDNLGVLQVAHAFELLRDAQPPWPSPPNI